MGFILLPLKCPINFFFELALGWSAVITGYNDEYNLHTCASVGLLHVFKLAT